MMGLLLLLTYTCLLIQLLVMMSSFLILTKERASIVYPVCPAVLDKYARVGVKYAVLLS